MIYSFFITLKRYTDFCLFTKPLVVPKNTLTKQQLLFIFIQLIINIYKELSKNQ